MTTEDGLSGNIGEWSEFYTFCYLLNAGILKTADRYLNPNSSESLSIIKIIRNEDGEIKDYCPEDDKFVRVYVNGREVATVPKTEFERTVSELYDKLKNHGLRDPMFLQKMSDFMSNICCTKIKANPTEKEDIVIKVKDPHTNQSPVQGFSIKSYIGSNPTLLNAGKTTNFTYRIKGCDRELMERVNSIDTFTKLKDRIKSLFDAGCDLEYYNMDSGEFRRNLQKVDSLMPQILAEMLKLFYITGKKNLSDIAYHIDKVDPLGMKNKGYYVYKVKTMLCAFALGMVPSRRWDGIESANGGYIVVKEDGDVVCFFLYDRNVFEDYLLDCTYFDKASTDRYEYMQVYEQDGDFFIKFNLQIRFNHPDPKRHGVVTLDEF